MIRIGPAISVKEEVLVHLVFVRRLPPLDHRHGRNRQRHLGQDRRLEDSLRSQKRNALPIEPESLGEQPPGKSLTAQFGLIPKELERGDPDPLVNLPRRSPWILILSHVALRIRRCRQLTHAPPARAFVKKTSILAPKTLLPDHFMGVGREPPEDVVCPMAGIRSQANLKFREVECANRNRRPGSSNFSVSADLNL
jgi:hypothetical protein